MIIIPDAKLQTTYQEVIATEKLSGRTAKLKLLESIDSLPTFAAITTASVIPFLDKDKLVATLLPRGIDIPGGHTESYDKDVACTLIREAKEETGIDLSLPLYAIGVISWDWCDADPTKTTYMLIATSTVATLNDYTASYESLGRQIVSPEHFLNQYTAGSHAMMTELIKRAQAIVGTIL